MEYCKYHPLLPATYHCNQCQTNNCDDCIDDQRGIKHYQCLLCNNTLKSLGSANIAEPFWRRLQQSFYYPLSSQSLIMIISIAIFTAGLSYLPPLIALIPYLLLTGMIMKYAFSCLEYTALGTLTAPDITESYGGGITLVIQLAGIFIIIGALIAATYHFLGSGAAMLTGLFMTVSLPAIFINFSINNNLTEALNPFNALRLMTAIGAPYLLLLIFIFIMFASVGVINEVLGNTVSLLNIILQSIVSNYYTIVIFHIMGYMVFQYQDKLGFIAREKDDENVQKTEEERLKTTIDIYIKEGDFDKATTLFANAVKKEPTNKLLHKRFFDFLCAIKNKEYLNEFTSNYLDFLIKNGQTELLTSTYKRVTHIDSHYMPALPSIRFTIAENFYARGDAKTAIKLLNGLYKQHPEYSKLIDAYTLMVDCLKSLPNMESNVAKCQRLISHLLEKKEADKKETAKRTIPPSPYQTTKIELCKKD